MTPKKGQYTSGQAYVAFSRVRELNKLHIINYTHEQIQVSEHVAAEMDRLKKKTVPSIPKIHVPDNSLCLSILHINIGGLKAKIEDVRQENLFQKVDVISFNETHLPHNVSLSYEFLGIPDDFIIFNHNHDGNGGGIALVMHKTLCPEELHVSCSSEILAAKVARPFDVVLICVYRPPAKHICDFAKDLCSLVKRFNTNPVCIVGNFNEDIFVDNNCHCYTKLINLKLNQVVNIPTCDSGTLIDYMYISSHLTCRSTVTDCYFSDHDFVFGAIQQL